MQDSSVAKVNPNSKSILAERKWDSVEQLLIKYFGNAIKIVFTEGRRRHTARSLESIYRKLLLNIYPICVDGIIHEVTDGLLDLIVIKNSNSFKILRKLINIQKGE